MNKIPFKHGINMNMSDIKDFERKSDFSIPYEILDEYGKFNGGGIDGWLVFNEKFHFAISTFLGFGVEKYNCLDSVETALSENAILKNLFYRKNEKRFLPIAMLESPILYYDSETYNINNENISILISNNNDNLIHLLRNDSGIISLELTFKQFLDKCAFWFQYEMPSEKKDFSDF